VAQPRGDRRAKRVRRSLSEAKAKTDWSGIMWYVYIIRSASSPDQDYIGATTDLKRRMADHNAGKSTHTAKFIP